MKLIPAAFSLRDTVQLLMNANSFHSSGMGTGNAPPVAVYLLWWWISRQSGSQSRYAVDPVKRHWWTERKAVQPFDADGGRNSPIGISNSTLRCCHRLEAIKLSQGSSRTQAWRASGLSLRYADEFGSSCAMARLSELMSPIRHQKVDLRRQQQQLKAVVMTQRPSTGLGRCGRMRFITGMI